MSREEEEKEKVTQPSVATSQSAPSSPSEKGNLPPYLAAALEFTPVAVAKRAAARKTGKKIH